MSDWRKERDYRPVKDEDGNVVGGIITVDGREIEVSRDVYLAYSQADRRDRYVAEQYENGTLISLEYLQENHISLDRIRADLAPDAEEELLRRYDREQMQEILIPVLNALNDADKALIQALYFDELSERECAEMLGIRQSTLQNRRNNVLRKICRTIIE